MASVEPFDHNGDHRPLQGPYESDVLKSVLKRVERDLILGALRESQGNRAKAAGRPGSPSGSLISA